MSEPVSQQQLNALSEQVASLLSNELGPRPVVVDGLAVLGPVLTALLQAVPYEWRQQQLEKFIATLRSWVADCDDTPRLH